LEYENSSQATLAKMIEQQMRNRVKLPCTHFKNTSTLIVYSKAILASMLDKIFPVMNDAA
jgi:hypothetical protein